MRILFVITAFGCAWALAEYAFRLARGQTMLRDEYAQNKIKKEHDKKHQMGMVADAALAAAKLRRRRTSYTNDDDGEPDQSKSSETGAPPHTPSPIQKVRLAALQGARVAPAAPLRD